MKPTLQSFIGPARYRRLKKQAVEQGVDFAKARKDALILAAAKHPEDKAAAVAFAACRLLLACNSKPTPEEVEQAKA